MSKLAISVNPPEVVTDSSPTNGGSLEMYMVEKLIDLTEQSVKAQYSTVSEIKELRTELAGQSKNNTKEYAAILQEVRETNKSRVRQVADWVAQNTATASVMFIGTLLAAVLVVLISQTINADKINTLRNTNTSTTPVHAHTTVDEP